MSAALEINNLVVRYGTTEAVSGLSLDCEGGAVTAIVGPNGAGKTTTVETCEGYRSPHSGTVSVLGLDPVKQATQLHPRIGVMLQSGGVPSGAKAAETLA
ncbi:MAG TPA: ABC transporter, partial [Actinobacteria bacterium]|nr:ABC transporter [Actinomycetota bacterium]